MVTAKGETNNTAMRDETAKVKTAGSILGRLQRLLDHVVLAKLALLDRLINADNILPDDTTSADVEMADFGVAHKAFGEANGKRGSFELGEAGWAP